ncbi:hypothetical protein AERO_18660, partial [Aeromicrobium fastidiosum]|nr:hypothetical protein [Aeromicrobium fastidiosum]
MVMRTAAAVPNRIRAGATFHGGGFVTDTPDSPVSYTHLRAHETVAKKKKPEPFLILISFLSHHTHHVSY